MKIVFNGLTKVHMKMKILSTKAKRKDWYARHTQMVKKVVKKETNAWMYIRNGKTMKEQTRTDVSYAEHEEYLKENRTGTQDQKDITKHNSVKDLEEAKSTRILLTG